MPSIFVQSLSPRLQRLLAPDARARAAVDPLTADEISALTAAARDNRETQAGLAPHRAIGLLALAARPDVALPVLTEIARDQSARTTNRVAALHGLGRLATPEAQTALVVADAQRRPAPANRGARGARPVRRSVGVASARRCGRHKTTPPAGNSR